MFILGILGAAFVILTFGIALQDKGPYIKAVVYEYDLLDDYEVVDYDKGIWTLKEKGGDNENAYD